MASDLLRTDDDRTYKVDHGELMRIINKRSSVPESIRHQTTELHNYVNCFRDDATGKIDYSGFINDL